MKQKENFIKFPWTMKQTKKCLEEEPFYKTFLPDPEQFEKIKKVNILLWNKNWQPTFQIFAHVGLYVGLVAYTAIGAKVSLYITFSIKDIDGPQ